MIQTVFGWEDYHLFEFQDKEYQCTIRIAVPSEDDFDFEVKTLDASKVRLSDLFIGNFRKLLYVYDFGDNWVHEITLEKIFNDKRKEAFCLSGKGNCPPEDCGGPYEYEDMKNIFQTMPDSKVADEYRYRLGFDKDEIWESTALISMKYYKLNSHFHIGTTSIVLPFISTTRSVSRVIISSFLHSNTSVIFSKAFTSLSNVPSLLSRL